MTIQTILVAVDGSAHSDVAVDCAAELALGLNAPLIILHVVASINEGPTRHELENLARMERNAQTEDEILQDYGRSVAATAEQRARKKGAQRIEALVEVGDPATCIVEKASSRNVDLVVLGRRGLGTLTGLVVGSVSYKVIQTARCAVLVTPP
jgi:nucleotide-binding universal stress UspA family protein